ncbi:hypothetical protein [Herbiconiux flava]|uniref:Uncharacterized protein n=1 Tax=Herbiconiux flava TaxID=881268 RepID=A0A852SID4_9MICO|nr:hypothetical protein [Herbiconiux flava]NYD69524.1 hypothetical protein [Herbiconiux flava]GLK16270.1 hypothetical protein GCM10017602_07520 [Herbiconiux flava]
MSSALTTVTARGRSHAATLCASGVALPLGAGVVLVAVHLTLFESSFYLGPLTLVVEAAAVVAVAWAAGLLTARKAGVDRPVLVTSCTLAGAVVVWVIVVGILGQIAAMVLVAAVMSFADARLVATVIVVAVFTALAVLFVLTATVLLSRLFARVLRHPPVVETSGVVLL